MVSLSHGLSVGPVAILKSVRRRTLTRRATAFVHLTLAAPGVAIVVIALIAVFFGRSSDPHNHGVGAALALTAGGIAVVPVLGYLGLVRSWWLGRAWLPLAAADGALVAAALALVAAGYAPGPPWVATSYAALALTGIASLWLGARVAPPV